MSETVTVHIPTPLRSRAGDQATIDARGGTAGEVLNGLSQRYPELGSRLFTAENEINRFVAIFKNDEDIRFLQNLDTTVAPGDDLVIVPAIAGG